MTDELKAKAREIAVERWVNDEITVEQLYDLGLLEGRRMMKEGAAVEIEQRLGYGGIPIAEAIRSIIP